MSSKSRGTKRKATSAVTGKTTVKKSTTTATRKPKGMANLSCGEIITDLFRKEWRLGPLMGWGGFGALYYASSDIANDVNDKAEYVAKVEPHSNGPLFGEVHFYQRACKMDKLEEWISLKQLKSLGVPAYIGTGCYENKDKKFRFLIMERYGEDVDQLFAKHQRCFGMKTVLTLGIRILDILEYIHNQGYVHADIKGSNLMMGYVDSKKGQVFLVDYGLACLYNPGGTHKEYKVEPKRKHDGTIEFTSIDAHKGVAPSRRTDLEILGYVMLQWLSGRLPWEDNLRDKEYVMRRKIECMGNIPRLFEDCGQESSVELQEYFEYVVGMEYEEEPNYDELRKIFQDGLREREMTDDGKTVEFLPGETGPVENGHSSKEGCDDLRTATDQEGNEECSPAKRKKTNTGPARKKRKTSAADGEAVKKPPLKKPPLKKPPSKKPPSKKPPLKKPPLKKPPLKKPPLKKPPAKKSPAKKSPLKRGKKVVEVDEKVVVEVHEKVVVEVDEKPAKRRRGRPKKVMVNTATSP